MTLSVFGIVCVLVVGAGIAWFAIEKGRRRTHPVTGGLQRATVLPHTAPVELYSNAFSHCSRKTRLVLTELGIEFKHHGIELIETGWYQTISADYLAINPSGLVPTLVHEGHPVFESDDILAYAQTIAPQHAPQLIPADAALREQMDHWLDFCTISSGDAMAGMAARAGACVPGLTMPLFVTAIRHIPLRNILVGFLFHFDRKRPAMFTASKLFGLRFMVTRTPVRALMHASRDHMRRHLLTLNAALAESDGEWILGSEYSLADITLACLLLRLEETGWLAWFEQAESIGEVRRYYERLQARQAWAEAIDGYPHPIVAQARSDLRQAATADPALGALIYGDLGELSARQEAIA